MKWFRFYDEALDDPKVQRLSATMFRHWVNILCLANREPNRGYLPPLEDVAFGLRVNERKAQQIIDTLVGAGLLTKNPDSTVEPHGWKQRQRVSDNVAERVAKHRARNADVTLQETDSDNESNVTETFPHARATDTETDTETDTPHTPQGVADPDADSDTDETDAMTYSDEFEAFMRVYPKRVGKGAAWRAWKKLRPSKTLQRRMADAVKAQSTWPQWQRENGKYIPNPATWINQARWDDEPPQAASNVRRFVV